ncbi:hypothetical protein SAMN05446935_7487 [Burkholderia sp. YR290]|nr:hypothetical protein SAMN05446935_7487 [Burkholderia sp. YR290]
MDKAVKRQHSGLASGAGVTCLTADERAAKGRELRNKVQHASPAGWKPPTDRREPVERLSESNEGRIMELA